MRLKNEVSTGGNGMGASSARARIETASTTATKKVA
jgi:hypothetical protein